MRQRRMNSAIRHVGDIFGAGRISNQAAVDSGQYRHTIRIALRIARVILSPIGCGHVLNPLMVPVRPQADPSPPTLKPQEFILIEGLLVL